MTPSFELVFTDQADNDLKILEQSRHLNKRLKAVRKALAYLEKMKFKAGETVVICISGRGDKDLDTYIKYFSFSTLLL